jgi:glycosyltransferase involved in cell wall biosynthesis
MIVGYDSNGYSEKRNIIGIVPDVDYVGMYNIYKFIRRAAVACDKVMPNRSLLNNFDLQFSFSDLNLNNVDVMHFFNTISFSKKPWITTFETIVPRFKNTLSLHHGQNCSFESLKNDKRVLKALDALSSESCKRLIAMSECNLNMQKDLLKHFPQYHAEIENKLVQLHPPQKLIVDTYESKQLPLNGQIHFMFVGSSFFRKGGMEMLEAFSDSIKHNGHNIKLTIVSSLNIDNYATKETEQDVKKARGFINNNSSWINYVESLPNKDVIELMKTAHVGLLPTYADTYGYSLLEFQACGCPVISTNVRALPEINNNKIGWVINIPKNHLGEAVYTTKENRSEIGITIKQGLVSIINEIMENSQVIFQKANAALMHIKGKHSPEIFAKRLREIYMRTQGVVSN